jgi:glucose 1-dehydrogenase
MGALDGRVVVITGGTRGLGLAIARAAGAAGASVVVSSRSPESVARAVADLDAAGVRAAGIAGDVGSLVDVEALAAHAIATFGRFDVWVNNAGSTAPYGPTAHVPPGDFAAATRSIVFGTYHGSIVALRHFLPSRSGKLINLLGWGDKRPVPFQNAYASGKAWVRSFSLALAEEYRDSGVGVFAYNPGMLRTDLILKVPVVAGYEAMLKSMPTVVRLLARDPEEAASEVVRLASAATDGRTGIEVQSTKPIRIAARFLGDRIARLFRRASADARIEVRSVPPAV